jgi:hypothetical protein
VRDGRDSHIIPRFVLDWQKKHLPGRLRNSQTPNKRVQDYVKGPLLCHDCEERFSEWETKFRDRIFAPVHRGELATRALPYGRWAVCFAMSVSWRVATFLREETGFPAHTDDERSRVLAAMNRWRQYLVGETRDPGSHVHHLLPLTVLVDHSVPGLSPFMNRYIVSAVDMDLVRSNVRIFAYAKLGQILLFSSIREDYPEHWRETALSHQGQIAASTSGRIPAEVIRYISEKASLVGRSLAELSPRQRAKIADQMERDAAKMEGSLMEKAIEADVIFSGLDALTITNEAAGEDD